ncbi:MAG: SurA N-terminal domain-containing protein [Desulfobacterales bacterium]|nr:MAG: SurA N-terminal domain-containing protein [Desulfobacterales bacterium]
MSRLKTFFSNKMAIFIVLLVLIITVAVAFGYKKSKDNAVAPALAETTQGAGSVKETKSVTAVPDRQDAGSNRDDWAKAVFDVGNMSCSGCIATIKSSVAGFQGIKETLVELSSGKVEIYFDADQLQDLSLVAKAITDSGYPATVLRTLSADVVKKERALAEARSKYYVASVGGWDIARSDFDTELETAKRRYTKIYGEDLFAREQGKTLLDNLKAQTFSKLLDEGIMMQEIVKADFKVAPDTVERQIQELLAQHGKNLDQFKASLNEIGYDYEYFRKKFEIKVRINQYLNERILSDASNDLEKQNLFNAWFKNSKVLAEVIYYDRDLEGLIQRLSASSGCGVSG